MNSFSMNDRKTVPDDVSSPALRVAGSLRSLVGLPRCRLHLSLVLACHSLTSKGGQQVSEDFLSCFGFLLPMLPSQIVGNDPEFKWKWFLSSCLPSPMTTFLFASALSLEDPPLFVSGLSYRTPRLPGSAPSCLSLPSLEASLADSLSTGWEER